MSKFKVGDRVRPKTRKELKEVLDQLESVTDSVDHFKEVLPKGIKVLTISSIESSSTFKIQGFEEVDIDVLVRECEVVLINPYSIKGLYDV